EFHAVIKHLHMKGLTPKEIKAELNDVRSTSASAFATIYNVNEFKHGTSTCDVPLLFVDKRDCVTISKQCLMFQRNPDEFLRRFITVNETWIHYFTSETKENFVVPSLTVGHRQSVVARIARLADAKTQMQNHIHRHGQSYISRRVRGDETRYR
ncbi:hypothetical protein ALC56_13143, partial [Trachymyrmex septentrionalis]